MEFINEQINELIDDNILLKHRSKTIKVEPYVYLNLKCYLIK